MKRNFILIAAVCGMLVLSGNVKAQSMNDLMSNKTVSGLVNKVNGTAASTKPQSIVGVWKYKGTACTVQSDNVLAKASAEVINEKVEEQLNILCAKAGFNTATSNFIFTATGVFVNTVGTQKFTGKYSYNKANGVLVLNYQQLSTGVAASVISQSGTISILLDANKMIELVSAMNKNTSDETIKSVTAMLNECKGLKVGFRLGK